MRFINGVRRAIACIFRFRVEACLVFVRIRFNFLNSIYVVAPIPAFDYRNFSIFLCFNVSVYRFFFNFKRDEYPGLVWWFVCNVQYFYRAFFRYGKDVIFVSRRLNFFRANLRRFTRRFLIIMFVSIVSSIGMSFRCLFTRISIVNVLRGERSTKVVRNRGPFTFRTYFFDYFNDANGRILKWSNWIFFFIRSRLRDVNFLLRVLTRNRLWRKGLAVWFARFFLAFNVRINASACGVFVNFFRRLLLLFIRVTKVFVSDFSTYGGFFVWNSIVAIF